ncbi:MAG: M48 family metalloprotease [Acidobacteriia bacterium]|nr:M48 family metalloprotease [Terriglobia bacterium]
MSVETILGTAFVALLNSLWQSAALALLVWAALRFLPRVNVRLNAATRCAVWWAVLAAVVLLPMGFQPRRPLEALTAAPSASLSQAPASPESVVLTPAQTPLPSRGIGPLQVTAGAGLLAIFAIWSALSLFRMAQIIRSYRYLRGIKQRSHAVSPERLVNFNYWLLACGVDRTARLLVSSEIVSPMAVGFRRPAVIVPETLLNEFTAEELDHVLLHELAHIARYDDWTNLFARLIGALLPIHPVAVWLLRRIEQEREVACDDWVVAMTGEARPYAASLTRLFELCSARRRQLLATGMADRASHLGERIEALLRAGRDFAPRVSLVRLALGAAILAALVLAGARAPQWVAFAQEPPFPVSPPVPPLPPQAPAPPVAPEPPQSPEPPVATQGPRELQHDIEAVHEEVADQIRAAEAQLRAQQEQLRAAQAQLANQRAQGRRAEEIRAFEAQLQAQKAQVLAMQAAVRAQNEQQRAAEQSRASSPGGSFLAALVAAGYGNLPVDAIIELRNSGVSAEFLRSVADAGWGKLSVKELMDLAHSGVSPQYLRALRDAGFKNLTVPEAIDVAHSGVRPDLIRALKDAFPQVTMREIIEAAHSGLNPNDLRQAREYGPNLTLEQIIRLKHAGVI